MDALEIGVLRLVSSLDKHLEATAHQIRHATANHALLAEKVGLGLLVHRGLHDSGTGAANARNVCKSNVLGTAGGVLLHGHQAGHALAGHKLAADSVPGTLGRRHKDVDVGTGHNLLVADVEAVGEGNRVAGLQVRCDGLAVDVGRHFVVDQDHHDVSQLRRVLHAHRLETRGLRLLNGLAARTQTHDHVHPGILQVQCVGMTLGTVSDNRYLLAFQIVNVTILLVVHFRHL